MNQTRRGFLQTMLAAAVGTAATGTFDPERLLWVPGAKTFFLPSPTLVTAQTMDEAIEEGLVASYPDGTLHIIRGSLAIYGGYDAFVQRVRAHGGDIVPRREWITHGVTED